MPGKRFTDYPFVCEGCGKEFFIWTTARHRSVHFCSNRCRGKTHRWTPEHFWRFVDKTASCWIWKGAQRSGYGICRSSERRTTNAHRLSWILTNGLIDSPELHVCHNCPGGDNPLCVNPSHLFLATHAENQKDGARKGTRAKKLTREAVKQIRIQFEQGMTKTAIGQFFGVSRSTIAHILIGKTWNHVL